MNETDCTSVTYFIILTVAIIFEALSLHAGIFLRSVIVVKIVAGHLLANLHLIPPLGTHTDLQRVKSGQLAFLVQGKGVALLVSGQLALILLVVYLRGVEITFLLVGDPAWILVLSIALHHYAQ